MRRLFLHIGLPKTGTSYIQEAFQHNREFFAQEGIYYPQAGQHELFRDSGHHLLPIAFMLDRWDELELQFDIEEVRRSWQNLIEELRAVTQPEIVLSSEWFSLDVYRPEDIAAIKTLLADYDVHVILVLRDVVDFVTSVHSQRVRDGYAGSAADYIKLAWPHLNWLRIAQQWERVFGTDRVMALNFDKLRVQGLLPTMTQVLFGRSIVPPGLTMHAAGRNRSLSAAATEMLREVNASGLDPETQAGIRDRVKELYDRLNLSAGKSPLSPDLQDLLRHACEWPTVHT